MLAALVPILVYVISAILLYAETCMIATAMDHLRHVHRPSHRRVAVCLLVLPLVLLSTVPVILLLTLGHDCTANMRTLMYAGCLWAIGLLAGVPAYWYAKSHGARPKSSSAARD